MKVENVDWRGFRLVVKRYVLTDALRIAAETYHTQAREHVGNAVLAKQFIWQWKTAIELMEVLESREYDTLRAED
jgi:hypothetical protein